jgi:hypothetical protein
MRQSRRWLTWISSSRRTAPGGFYYWLGNVYAELTGPKEQLTRVQQLRADLRDAFDP